jgi:flavodoxin
MEPHALHLCRFEVRRQYARRLARDLLAVRSMTQTTPRILVVFFSRSGTTREVALQLGARLDADLEEISDTTPRKGVLGFLRSGIEAQRRQLPPIGSSRRDPAAYDLVIIGTPVWASSVSSPVRAYLRRHRGVLKAVAFFCTCGGTGSHSALAQMQQELGREPVVRLQLRQDDVGTVSAEALIERFVDRVHAALAPLQEHAQS